jgi:hypothetical protein
MHEWGRYICSNSVNFHNEEYDAINKGRSNIGSSILLLSIRLQSATHLHWTPPVLLKFFQTNKRRSTRVVIRRALLVHYELGCCWRGARKRRFRCVFVYPSTQWIQPTDVTFMRPFKICYTHEINAWLENHSGRAVTHYNIFGLVSEAYLGGDSVETDVNSFRKKRSCSCERTCAQRT